MRRRHALHLVAASLVPVAGCAAPDQSSSSTELATTTPADGPTGGPSPTPTATASGPLDLGEPALVDGLGAVTVEALAVQRSVVRAHAWRDVHEPDGAQVLVIEGSVGGGVDEDLSFVARLDGAPVESSLGIALEPDGTRYALSVPVRRVGDAAVVLDAGDRPAWTVPVPVRARLAAASSFHLHEATVRSGDGGTVLDLTVENRGDRDGTFRCIVVSKHAADADAAVRFPVPTGETVTETVDHDIVRNWAPDDGFVHDVTPDTRRFAVGYA